MQASGSRSPLSSPPPEIKTEQEGETPTMTLEESEDEHQEQELDTMGQLDEIAAGPSSSRARVSAPRRSSREPSKGPDFDVGDCVDVLWETEGSPRFYEAYVIEISEPRLSGLYDYKLAHTDDGSVLKKDRDLRRTKKPPLPAKFVAAVKSATQMTDKKDTVKGILLAAKGGATAPKPKPKPKSKKKAVSPQTKAEEDRSGSSSGKISKKRPGATGNATQSKKARQANRVCQKRPPSPTDSGAVSSSPRSPEEEREMGFRPGSNPTKKLPPTTRMVKLEKFYSIENAPEAIFPRLEHIERSVYGQVCSGTLDRRLAQLEEQMYELL